MADDEYAGPQLDIEVLLDTLVRHNVDFVLVGGVAALMHGATRQTRDADVVVADDPRNHRRLLSALAELHARPRSLDPERDRAQAARKRSLWHIDDVAGSFLAIQTDAGPLDVMPWMDGPEGRITFDDLAPASEEVGVGSETLIVRIASLDHIIAAKEAANRPKDLDALKELRRVRDRQDRLRKATGPSLDDDGTPGVGL